MQIKIYTHVWQGRWVKDDRLMGQAEQNRYQLGLARISRRLTPAKSRLVNLSGSAPRRCELLKLGFGTPGEYWYFIGKRTPP